MHAGIPLTDADRAPWLATLHEVLLGWYRSGTSGVLACSALRQAYRDELSAGIPSAELRFVLLEVPKDVLQERMAERKNHYMSPALLDSQIATLEMPQRCDPGRGGSSAGPGGSGDHDCDAWGCSARDGIESIAPPVHLS